MLQKREKKQEGENYSIIKAKISYNMLTKVSKIQTKTSKNQQIYQEPQL